MKVNSLIPTRFMLLIAHLVITIVLFTSIVSITLHFPFSYLIFTLCCTTLCFFYARDDCAYLYYKYYFSRVVQNNITLLFKNFLYYNFYLHILGWEHPGMFTWDCNRHINWTYGVCSWPQSICLVHVYDLKLFVWHKFKTLGY